MAIDPESAHDQAVEVSHQEIGQVEGARLRLVERREALGSREELVAMRTRQTFDSLFLDNFIDLPPGTAFRVSDVYIAISIAILVNSCA